MTTLFPILLALAAGAGPADTVRLNVDRTGLQMIAGEQLEAAGIRLDATDPALVGLRCGPDTVALRLTGLEDGQLTAASQMIFYGTALDTRFTTTNVYWLSFDGQHVARMREFEPLPAEGEAARSFTTTLRLEQNNTYAYLIGDRTEGELRPWFWGLAQPDGPLETDLPLPHLADPDSPAMLRVRLRARTSDPRVDPDHHVTVSVNDVPVVEARFDGPKWLVLEQSIPPGALQRGPNTAILSCRGDTGSEIPEQVYLDWIEVEYERNFSAEEAALEIFVSGGEPPSIEITDIEGETVDWYDLSEPLRPAVAPGMRVIEGTARLGLGAEGTHYVAVAPDGYVPVASVTKVPAPYLRETGLGADYLIIAHEDLVEPVTRLAEYRRGQGLQVEIVPVGQIYNEFSAGVFTPYAIRDFVAYTLAEWDPRPQYLLLVGDATYDYRDYRGTGFPNLVPTVMAREGGGIEVAADAGFVVNAETGIPALAVGRFPASTPEQLGKLIDSTIEFERLSRTGEHTRKMVFVADQEGFGPLKSRFEQACDLWSRDASQAGFAVEKFYQTQVGLTEDLDRTTRIAKTREALTPGLVESLRDGPYGVFFTGHGDELFWGYNKLLTTDDLREVEGQAPCICIQDTCFSAGLDLPGAQNSLTESLLWSGVCAASYAPSRLGGNDVQRDLLRRLIDGNIGRLGQAILEDRSRRLRGADGFWVSGSNFNLLGDPALWVNVKPEGDAQ